MVDGMVFDQKAAKSAGGPTKVENAKIALIQFHVSPPKSDLENNIIISDYAQVGAPAHQPSCRSCPRYLNTGSSSTSAAV